MTSHEQYHDTGVRDPEYDPKRQIREDEEKLARDAVRGVFVVLIVVSSIGVGAFFALYAEDSYRSAHPPEILNKKTWGTLPDHMFTNPVLFVDGDKGDYPEFQSFDNELNGYIAEVKRSGDAEDVAVYFRDLNSGHWTGINEDDEYSPTDDLQKILLMLAYDKDAEHDPAVLSQELYYQPVSVAGGFYSVQDLIDDMIRYPDDAAEKVLTAFHPDYIATAQADFHFNYATSIVKEAKISARQYALIFHDLYDGTYLPPEISEKALSLLALTGWNGGILAGMRLGIATDQEKYADADQAEDAKSATPVAHAFGEYTDVSTPDVVSGIVAGRELHDCGIVYFPAKPYILCVMTRANSTGQATSSFAALAGVISTISRLTYNYVDDR